MSLLILALALVGQGPVAPETPPPAHAEEVVVKARRPIVVVGNACPAPDPTRHPADHAPQVIDSYPAQNALVAPGYVRIRVTFDAPMSCFSEVSADGGGSDPCQPDGTWELPDRRSFLMQCRLEPSTGYRMRFRRSEGQGFVGLSGRPAEAYDLAFTTSGGPAVSSPAQAAALDPGPPGARGVTAYVTCANAPNPKARHDCQRTTLPAQPGG